MVWNVEYTNEFGEWYRGLSETQQDDITAGTLLLLMELGPQLPIPHPGTRTCASFACKAAAGRFGRFTSSIRGDRRSCLLAAKTGDNHFDERMVPVADYLYDTYIDEIRKEALIP